MDTREITAHLLAVGEKIKAKGWRSSSVNVYVEYLAIFDGDDPLNRDISYMPSIRASTKDKYRSPTSHEFVRNAWGCRSMDDAIARLIEAADEMPTHDDEVARIEAAKSKLSDQDKRLLGIR